MNIENSSNLKTTNKEDNTNLNNESKSNISLDENKIEMRNIETKEEYENSIYKFLVDSDYNPCLCNPQLYGLGDEEKKHNYVGYINDKPVYCNSAHIYHEQNIVFMGNYYMVPGLRGKGLGSKFYDGQFNKIAKEYSNLYMCAVSDMSDKYCKKFGFKNYADLKLLFLTKASSELKVVSKCIRDLKHLKTIEKEYLEFNKKVFNYEKEAVDRRLLEIPEVDGVCSISQNNKLQGFGFMKRNYTGWLFGPICADSQEIAEDIILSLYNKAELNQEIKLIVPVEYENLDKQEMKYERIKSLLGFELVSKLFFQGRSKLKHNFNYYFGMSNMEHSY